MKKTKQPKLLQFNPRHNHSIEQQKPLIIFTDIMLLVHLQTNLEAYETKLLDVCMTGQSHTCSE